MSLPKLSAPEHTIKLHSLDYEIKYRPFLVKEEKILLMAVESKNEDVMMKAVKQIIDNCCLEEKKIKVEDLPLFDLELWFLNLRAKSVGESIELKLPCRNCEERTEVNFNINDVQLQIDPEHNDIIKITDTISIQMKYPNIKQFARFTPSDTSKTTDKLFSLVRDCVKSIIEEDKVFDASLQTKSELEEFIQSLNSDQFKRVVTFFDTMPILAHTLEYTCKNKECETKNVYTITGIENFFLS